MPLTDLALHAVYNHGNCPDLLTGLYEPLLAQAVRYDRTTCTFTADELVDQCPTAVYFCADRHRRHRRLDAVPRHRLD